MRVRLIFTVIIFCFTSVFLNGCFTLFRPPKEKTLKQKVLAEIWYISTSKQSKTLKKLNTPEEIRKFLEDFWRKLDPTPGTPKNELRIEYYKRIEHVNEHCPDRRGWGRSDRGRVYILYGSPDEIIRYPWMDISIMDSKGTFYSKIKSMEIWIYDRAAGGNRVPSIFVNLYPGQMKFVFADLTGLGIYTQIFSTELGECVDTRIYR